MSDKKVDHRVKVFKSPFASERQIKMGHNWGWSCECGDGKDGNMTKSFVEHEASSHVRREYQKANRPTWRPGGHSSLYQDR